LIAMLADDARSPGLIRQAGETFDVVQPSCAGRRLHWSFFSALDPEEKQC
jgi:hypothetical protein